ncbi:DUF3817 domain-containing protein [Nocardia araoensis]|uniref:DUF3817 domain-containing protein n=1 Tax=Nocardia araoensis TaxID=228600 RepID=UPI0007C81B5B|nr:DUF3817 domain-containing protein [Nocardia araoensis]
MNPRHALRIAAITEPLSLFVLLLNLVTVHWPMVATLIGPVHGCAYIAVIVLVFRLEGAGRGVKATALLPVVGGLLAFRALSRREHPVHHAPGTAPVEQAALEL